MVHASSVSILQGSTPFVDGVFFLSHWPSITRFTIPNRLLYLSHLLWTPWGLALTPIVIAIPQGWAIRPLEGTVQRYYGKLQVHVGTGYSVLYVTRQGIETIQETNSALSESGFPTRLISTGVVERICLETEDSYNITFQVVSLRRADSEPKIAYRVAQTLIENDVEGQLICGNIVTFEAVLIGYIGQNAHWIAEVETLTFQIPLPVYEQRPAR